VEVAARAQVDRAVAHVDEPAEELVLSTVSSLAATADSTSPISSGLRAAVATIEQAEIGGSGAGERALSRAEQAPTRELRGTVPARSGDESSLRARTNVVQPEGGDHAFAGAQSRRQPRPDSPLAISARVGMQEKSWPISMAERNRSPATPPRCRPGHGGGRAKIHQPLFETGRAGRGSSTGVTRKWFGRLLDGAHGEVDRALTGGGITPEVRTTSLEAMAEGRAVAVRRPSRAPPTSGLGSSEHRFAAAH